MNQAPLFSLFSLAPVALLVGCAGESERVLFEPSLHAFAGSEWSEPVHLPAPVNSPYSELGGAQPTPDGLSLYFASARPTGSYGAVDIWIVHRDCKDCPWGDAVNAGPKFNTATGDGSVVFTPDGLTMFFSGGDRPGGAGDNDIYVSHRTDPNDDFSWETPVNVGPGVNTSAHESGPAYVPAMTASGVNLYFTRDGTYYQTRVTRDGQVTGPVTPLYVGDQALSAGDLTVRADGRELTFMANRSGTIDLWVATRDSPNEPWSEPRNLSELNTAFADLSPSLSWDGRTLFFSAGNNARPGLGSTDIWMTTRTPSGR